MEMSNLVTKRIYDNIPAARDVEITFTADVLMRQTFPRHIRKTVRAALRDADNGEIVRGGASCCCVHAAKSLAKVVKKNPVYVDAPPPYSRGSSPDSACGG
jgi:hypothetical protein